MPIAPLPTRLLLAGLASIALAQPARAATDPRRIQCASACVLTLKAANGTIDIKIPTASGTLRTLAQSGDAFELEGGKDYVLFLKESNEGVFSFDLQFAPKAGGSTWSCRVQTAPAEPFISVDKTAWSGAPGQVAINTDRTKPFITLNSRP